MDTAVAPTPQFSALDRCDRCGAQAYVRVELVSGGELLFCAHHAREHAEKLQQVAATIHDDSERLSSDAGQRDQTSADPTESSDSTDLNEAATPIRGGRLVRCPAPSRLGP